MSGDPLHNPPDALEQADHAVCEKLGIPAREKTAISVPAHALMPGRNRAERRFALHCARRALRGTLSDYKRLKLARLTAEQARG